MIQTTRETVAALAREMFSRGLTDGTSGNVSVINREENLVAITPSDTMYSTMDASQVPVVDLEGNKVWGKLKPSSEVKMHLAVLAANPAMTSVMHTHSRYAIAVGSVHRSLPAITVDMAAFCGAEAPCLPYYTPGGEAVAEAAGEAVANGMRAMLLANHGALVVTPDSALLLDAAEALELAAMAYIRGSVLDTPRPIPAEDVDHLLDIVYGGKGAI